MDTRIKNLANQGDLENLSIALNNYATANFGNQHVAGLEISVNGTDYTGTYRRLESFIEYVITSPLPQSGSVAGFSQVTSGWSVDAGGQNVYVTTLYDNEGNPTVIYRDEPQGNILAPGAVQTPLAPVKQANTNYEQIGRGILPIDDQAPKDFSKTEDPDNPGTIIGVPAGCVGIVSYFVADNDDCKAFVTTELPAPTADGSKGIPVGVQQSFNVGKSPSRDGDVNEIVTSSMICETGKQGRFEVIFYRIA